MMHSGAGGGNGSLRRNLGFPPALAPFPLLRLTLDGRVLETNERLERELGLASDALLGTSLREVIPDSEAFDRVLTNGDQAPSRLRLVFPTPDGIRVRYFDAVRHDDVLWLLGRSADIDAEREELRQAHLRAEAQADEFARVSVQLQRANEQLAGRAAEIRDATTAKSRFLHTMSHELRTPLNAVLGYAGLLRDGVYGDIGARQLDAVQAIVRRARDLQLLIDDVLDLSRMEAGRLELRTESFSPAHVLSEVREAVEPAAREKELTLATQCDFRHHVLLDRAKYRQILLHLASNAVKFTPRQGKVELSVHGGADGTFETHVRDTGIGIPSERVESIFESFQQLESGNTRRFAGIGLGLSIVKRLVHIMGGTIAVRSGRGSGSTFVVTLPVALQPADTETVPGADLLRNGEPVLLAIDDDPEVIALLRDSLAPAGYQVVGATSGDRGLELARMLRPFAITLDVMMPGKDGWQVLREIKADAQLRDIPVIMMSIVAERALGFSLGVTEYLVKPVERTELLDVLGRLRDGTEGPDVLVVDDDADTRQLLADLLGNLGYLPRFARDAVEAIEQLDAKPPEVMIIDVTLPADDVRRVLETVSGDPRLSAVRTVVITRSDMEEPPELERLATALVKIHGNEEPHDLLRALRDGIEAIRHSGSGNDVLHAAR
jgi:signal transduction histidine kinase/CheY-like chemotaxis protein